WYKVVATAGQNLHIQTCGSTIDTVVAVYSGTCGSLTELACNDDVAVSCGTCTAPASSLNLLNVAPRTYTIRVSAQGIGLGGAFTLLVTNVVNDDCCSAIPVTCGSVTPGTTVGALAETGLPATCIGPQAPGVGQSFAYTNSVWYSVVAPPTGGTITADTI